MTAPKSIVTDAIEALQTFGVTRESRHLVSALLPLWARWPEMQIEDIEAVHDYFRPWGDTPRETLPTDAERLTRVRHLADDYADEMPPVLRNPRTEFGKGFTDGAQTMARAVLDVLDGDGA